MLARPEWSAARLIVVSAGNVDRDAHDHLRLSDTSVIDDPGQAWDARGRRSHRPSRIA